MEHKLKRNSFFLLKPSQNWDCLLGMILGLLTVSYDLSGCESNNRLFTEKDPNSDTSQIGLSANSLIQ